MSRTMKYFKPWLNRNVLYEKFDPPRSGANEKNYEDPVSVSCYIEGRTSRVVTVRGEEVLSRRQVYIEGDSSEIAAPDITEDDRFVLNGVIYPVRAIERWFDETGNLDCVVVFLS